MDYPATGRRSNQLLTWAGLGVFGESLTTELDVAALSALPQLAPLDDEARSLEERVRSYWDGNCSMCHGVNSQIRSNWDARYSTPLEDQGVLWGPTSSGTADEAAIWPGDPARSALFSRSNTTDPNRKMPPVGRNRIDARYVELMGRWIEALGEEATLVGVGPFTMPAE